MSERWVQAELRFLRGYAVVMSLVAAVFLVAAVRADTTTTSFDTINVHRINVTDADGRTRLALFGKQWEPPIILGGKAYSGRSGPKAAGLMFYNDQGDELGGLVYAGERKASGAISQGQSLTFDAYRQDQVVQLMQDQEGTARTAGLIVNDRPNVSMIKVLRLLGHLKAMSKAEIDAKYRKLVTAGDIGHARLFVGTAHKTASIELKDKDGRTRLLLSVSAAGRPQIKFFDSAGKVIRTIEPDTKG
ncbi:MAG: hypothetical protein KGO02_25545 [Alphaproteobacteria bacterium]|nr:hypothetical protein [Alphaproteobacteria bacterium]